MARSQAKKQTGTIFLFRGVLGCQLRFLFVGFVLLLLKRGVQSHPLFWLCHLLECLPSIAPASRLNVNLLGDCFLGFWSSVLFLRLESKTVWVLWCGLEFKFMHWQTSCSVACCRDKGPAGTVCFGLSKIIGLLLWYCAGRELGGHALNRFFWIVSKYIYEAIVVHGVVTSRVPCHALGLGDLEGNFTALVSSRQKVYLWAWGYGSVSTSNSDHLRAFKAHLPFVLTVLWCLS